MSLKFAKHLTSLSQTKRLIAQNADKVMQLGEDYIALCEENEALMRDIVRYVEISSKLATENEVFRKLLTTSYDLLEESLSTKQYDFEIRARSSILSSILVLKNENNHHTIP